MDFTPDSTINKLILLFVLDKMEIPLSDNSIMDICTSRNNWLNYMDCKDILWQLLETNFIYKINGENNEYRYAITLDGRDCLSHFYLKKPKS